MFINSGGWAAGTRYKHVNTDEFTHICTIFNIWDVFRALPATVTQKSKCCTETKYFQSSEPTQQENIEDVKLAKHSGLEDKNGGSWRLRHYPGGDQ